MRSTLKGIPGLRRALRFFKALFVPRHRNEWLLGRENPANLFQSLSQTYFNCYPRNMTQCRRRLNKRQDSALKSGGFLAIRGSNFRFSDTATSARFEVVWVAERTPRADTPIYGPDNRLIPGMVGDDGIFRKLGST